jgi:hypothetical protein
VGYPFKQNVSRGIFRLSKITFASPRAGKLELPRPFPNLPTRYAT